MVVVIVMKQLCTCRLRAGVVPGRGQRLSLLCSGCTCNCSRGVLCLCSGCSSYRYGSNQPCTTAQHPLTSLHQQQPIIHIEPSSTTTAASHHQSSRRHPFSYHRPTTCRALAPCLARTQPTAPPPSEEGLTGRLPVVSGVPSSNWKRGDGTGGNVWAP